MEEFKGTPAEIELQKEIANIKKSLSYKLGFGLTKPMRVIADQIKGTNKPSEKPAIAATETVIVSNQGEVDLKDFHLNIDSAGIVGNNLFVKGWAISDSGVKEVVIFHKGERLGSAKIGQARPDVAAIIDKPNNQNAGFTFELFWDSLEPGNENPKVEVLFVNKKGETVELETVCEVKMAGYESLAAAVDAFDAKQKETEAFSYTLEKPIDIIIPVYNGFKYLKPLFDSVQKNTDLPYRLLVIEDKSPDEKVLPYLKERAADFEDFKLLPNEVNLGFVKSVNRGFEYVENHFILLNTDVEVPPNWLSRLMRPLLENPKVASVTPFTNAGTICSFPEFLKDQEIFEDRTVDEVDAVFRKAKPLKKAIELPTGIGFCMAVNKKIADKIGMFDAETFGKGYGEENDWCMRAKDAGFKNVMAHDLFVYHKHGGSFEKAEKIKLNNENSKKLIARHPKYFERVGSFTNEDPLKKYRDLAILQLAAQLKEGDNVLVIDHNIGGGANIYRNRAIKKWLKNDDCVLVLQHQGEYPNLFVQLFFREHQIGFSLEDVSEIMDLLDPWFPVDRLFINNLVSYPKPYILLSLIEKIKKDFDCHLTVPIHDYFPLCPSYNLIDYKWSFCGVPDKIYDCKKCIKQVNYIPIVSDDIEAWRESWQSVMEIAEDVICFSEASKILTQRAFPTLKNEIKVIPHKVEDIPKINFVKESKTLNIGVLGTITTIKGGKILKEMLDKLKFGYLKNIKIVVLGELFDSSFLGKTYDNLVATGKYKREDLLDLVEEHEIDVFLIPSIWPETFSYTSEEIMKMDLPLAVFDLGAPAERVKKYNKGIIIEETTGVKALEVISDWYIKANPEPIILEGEEGEEEEISVEDFILKPEFNPISASIDIANRSEEKVALWGWAWSPFGIEKVKVIVNNGYVEDAFYGYQRQDIVGFYDGFKEMENSGFFYRGTDIYTPDRFDNQKGLARFVEVEVVDKKGNSIVIRKDFDFPAFGYLLHNLPIDTQYNIFLSKRKIEREIRKVKSKNLLSTIIYVDERYVKEAFVENITALLAQSYENWEAIICMPTYLEKEIVEILDRFTDEENKEKLKLYTGSNTFLQQLEDYTEAIESCKGEFIGFINANDAYDEHAFEEILYFAENQSVEEGKVDLIYFDEDLIGEKGAKAQPYFKNDFNKELFRTTNYIGNAFFVRKRLFDENKGINSAMKSVAIYDLLLRLLDDSTMFHHLPIPLYSRYAYLTEEDNIQNRERFFYTKKALTEHLERNNLSGDIIEGLRANTARIMYDYEEEPLVTIIVPFKDQLELLKPCVQSIIEKTDYPNYELLLISNNSEEEGTFEYLKKVVKHNQQVRYLEHNVPFNYSAINNWAVKQSKGELILFLNNDTEVIEEDWLTTMVGHAQESDVGGVGGKLLYDNDTLQHAGTVYGICGLAEHAFRGFDRDWYGRHKDMGCTRNVSICTAACLMVKRPLFEEIGGFDEENLVIAYNDVDLCMEIQKRGYLIVYSPYALLYHYESKSRGYEDTPLKFQRFKKEQKFMLDKWAEVLEKGDPYYSPNLAVDFQDYSLNI